MNNLDQVIRLAENQKCVWHLNLFSMTRVNKWYAMQENHFILTKAQIRLCILAMDPIECIQTEKNLIRL